MALPQGIVDWVNRRYPRPRVDPGWLEPCFDWVANEYNLDFSRPPDVPKLLSEIEAQYLQSDLRDSTIPSTGLPDSVTTAKHIRLSDPVLVEVVALTEIGYSAFSLLNTRQTRIDRADLAGLNATRGEDGEREEEEEGPVPRYQRGMLRFDLSDGTTTVRAIEYKRLPGLVLGETPLGYKMLLKNTEVRRGTIFLEPGTVELIGHQTEDRDVARDVDFKRGLRLRMGLPEIDPDDPLDEQPLAPAPAPPALAPPVLAPVAGLGAISHQPFAPNTRPATSQNMPEGIDDAFFDESLFDDMMEDDSPGQGAALAPPPVVVQPVPRPPIQQAPPPAPILTPAHSAESTLVRSHYWPSSSATGGSSTTTGTSTLSGPSSSAPVMAATSSGTSGHEPLFLPDEDEAAPPLVSEEEDFNFTDDGISFDADALAQIAAVEQRASQEQQKLSQPQLPPPRVRSPTVGGRRPNIRAASQASSGTGAEDAIMISDDEDAGREDTRRVRRRVGGHAVSRGVRVRSSPMVRGASANTSSGGEDNVIDISD